MSWRASQAGQIQVHKHALRGHARPPAGHGHRSWRLGAIPTMGTDRGNERTQLPPTSFEKEKNNVANREAKHRGEGRPEHFSGRVEKPRLFQTEKTLPSPTDRVRPQFSDRTRAGPRLRAGRLCIL
jgi:hypothetical protein